MRTLPFAFVFLFACYDASHVQVRLPQNAAGADCFAACQTRGDDAAVMACVRSCPGAEPAGGACDADRAPACVEHHRLSKWKTGGLVLVGVALTALVVAQ